MFNLRAPTLFLAFLATSVLAQDHSSETAEAQISDPNQECTPYYYAPVGNAIHNFPPVWVPATLLANDTQGQALWANISSSIPTNILPKGQINGSSINVTYDAVNDPDCWWSRHQCTSPKISGLPSDIVSVPEARTMGYAFDDGPNCTHNAFYNFLASNNQKATMFYIGSNVMDWPYEAQRGLADGHEICAHTWSHRYMTAFASEDAFAELYYSIQAIKLVTGVTPTCWRPPYGDVDDRIRSIAHALGLRTVIWRYDSFDWRLGMPVGNITGPNNTTVTVNITAADVDNDYNLFISNLTSGAFNSEGGIMLTHELNNFTMSEAIKWYPQLKSAFDHLVPIGVAFNITQPYVETNYSLPTFEQYISGEVTVSGSNNPSGTGSGSSPDSTSSTGSGSAKSSSAPALVVRGAAALWTALAATALLAGLLML